VKMTLAEAPRHQKSRELTLTKTSIGTLCRTVPLPSF
jgi:hypothetical protein